MISYKNLEEQLKRIHFNPKGWGHTEIRELCNILMPEEEIEECVNGYYEAGFALLVATKDRVLLVDKKPLNYLTVEDMRFDMINEFDYSHRLFGAQVKISAGVKTLLFTSANQKRLRGLLNFVQCRMTEIKREAKSREEAQKSHLEQMNQQLKMYLMIQQYQQHQLVQSGVTSPSPLATTATVFTHLMHPSTISPQQLGVSAMKRVVPVISAYTRLPMMSQRRRVSA